MDKPLITPDQVSLLQNGAAGALLSLLFQGQMTWWKALLIFVSGEICAFYLTHPIASFLSVNEGATGMTIGFTGMYLCGAGVKLLSGFQADPQKFLRGLPRPWWWSPKKDDK